MFTPPLTRSTLRRFSSSRRWNNGRRPRRDAHRRALGLENLEDRSLLAAGWLSTISGSGSEFVHDLDRDAVGNTYITGGFNSQPTNFGNIALSSDGSVDMYVAKLDADGQFLWATKFGNPPNSSDKESSFSIAADSDGNVVVTGWFEGTAQFGSYSLTSAGSKDVFVAKLDGVNGQFLWARQQGGVGDDRGYSVAVDSSGDSLVSGNSDGRSSVFVSKYTSDGAELWAQTVSGTMTGVLWSVAVDAVGDIYAAGTFNGTAEFPTGTLMSTANLEPVLQTDSSNALIAKLDQDGNWLWARQLEGDTFSMVRAMTIGSEGQLFALGRQEGTVDFDGVSVTSAGNLDLFVARFDSSGDVEWVQRMGGSAADFDHDIDVDSQGNVHVAGAFRGTAAFGPEILTADGGIENAFVTKLTADGAFVETHRYVTGTLSGTTNLTILAASLSIDAAGNLYLGGHFSGGTVQFPQQPVSGSYSTGFVVKLPPYTATKFYVVDDSSSNRTSEYAASGNAVENYGLNSGNSAPRGAASTAAGDKVWVLDANRKVYVYNPSGGLLGSWTAGSLPSNVQVEGIATNGTDVWIVDARGDKVYKYTGAASRLSGSQNAASSFALNSGNTNPKDIVADGVHLWVVNDSTTDKVFKYTVAGALTGSWTVSTVGAGSPTGITIDPSNVSDIWIVDASADKVFRYTAAASRTSGSQVAAASFALADGNTNPQGIADPPPRAMQQESRDDARTATELAVDAVFGQVMENFNGHRGGEHSTNVQAVRQPISASLSSTIRRVEFPIGRNTQSTVVGSGTRITASQIESTEASRSDESGSLAPLRNQDTQLFFDFVHGCRFF